MLEVPVIPTVDFMELVEGWLARSSRPASGLRAAQERIIHLELKIKQDTKMNELKHQEDAINAEKLEKVIMIMAREITNLQEGKMPELSMVKR